MMTFPNFPKRPSSEDNALDQALNAWASGVRHSERSEESRMGESRQENSLTEDAIEFHRWADETRRTDPAATGPAASTWNRVLRSTAQSESRGRNMNSAALRHEPQSAINHDVPKFNKQSISRYLNYAASLLIVFGVAFAGAFMAMQINQPDGSNGQFALFGQTDSATCDVEPLTVDRVMEIVKNPFPFMESGPAGEPAHPDNPDDLLNLEHFEAGDLGVELTLHNPGETPNDEDFDAATEIANVYLQCLIHGTRGQVWTFYSPAEIQRDVLRDFQVFADEDAVRARIEERISLPAYQYDELWNGYDIMWNQAVEAYVPASAIANPDPGVAIQRDHSGSHFEFLLTTGISLEDADGKQVFLSTGTGNTLVFDRSEGGYPLTVTIGKHRWYDQWYVIPVSNY